jgi:protein-tyrosine phosphatase
LQAPDRFVAGLRPLGRSRCVLIELPDDHLPRSAWATLDAVMGAGYRPILAHPERCRGLSTSASELARFVRLGGRLQLTLNYLLRRNGWRLWLRGRRLLSRFGTACVIASDSHNLDVRQPRWNELPDAWRRHVPASLSALDGI